jgi:hypothetical protein
VHTPCAMSRSLHAAHCTPCMPSIDPFLLLPACVRATPPGAEMQNRCAPITHAASCARTHTQRSRIAVSSFIAHTLTHRSTFCMPSLTYRSSWANLDTLPRAALSPWDYNIAKRRVRLELALSARRRLGPRLFTPLKTCYCKRDARAFAIPPTRWDPSGAARGLTAALSLPASSIQNCRYALNTDKPLSFAFHFAPPANSTTTTFVIRALSELALVALAPYVGRRHTLLTVGWSEYSTNLQTCACPVIHSLNNAYK